MSEERLTPFGEELKKQAQRKGLTLEQAMVLTEIEAVRDGVAREDAREDLHALVYVHKLERRRQEVIDGEYGALGFGQPN